MRVARISRRMIHPGQLAWHAPHLAPNVSKFLSPAQEGERVLKMMALGQESEVAKWPQRRSEGEAMVRKGAAHVSLGCLRWPRRLSKGGP